MGNFNSFHKSYFTWHMGEGLQTVLLTWYMTIHIGLSAEQIGLLQSLALLPFLLFIVIGGVFSDKVGATFSFKLVVTFYGLALFAIAAMDATIGFNYWIFALFCATSGVCSALANPAIDTFITESTNDSAEHNAVSASLIHNVAKFLGTASNLIVAYLGAAGGFVLNGLLMILSALFLTIHTRSISIPKAAVVDKSDEIRKSTSKVALSHLITDKISLDTVIASAALGLLTVPIGYIIWPLMIRESFSEYSWLLVLPYLTFWAGMIAASKLAVQLLGKLDRLGWWAIALWAGAGISIALLTVTTSFWMLALLTFLYGVLVSAAKPLVYGYYLANSPKECRTTLISFDQMAFWGMATLGTTMLGFGVSLFGITATVLIDSALFLGVILVVALRGNLSSVRKMDVQ